MALHDESLRPGDKVTAEEKFTSTEGIEVNYVHHENGTSILVIWFSAFTRGPHLGRVLKVTPGFHGYKFSRNHEQFDWLLVRDSWGYTQDGTYYGGRAGDLFVERAVSELVGRTISEYRERNPGVRIVAIGSSMGAYAAFKFAVLHGIPAFGWSPHLDMEIAMKSCGRGPWVRYCLEDADDETRDVYLHRLQSVVAEFSGRLPRLILQSTIDDPFVYPEQVVPFVDNYVAAGGSVEVDLRESGGHTSRHVPDEYLVEAVQCLANGHVFDIGRMRSLPSRVPPFRERFEHFLQSIEAAVMRLLIATGIRH